MNSKQSNSRYSFATVFVTLLAVACAFTGYTCSINTCSKKDREEMKQLYIMKTQGKRSLFPTVVGVGKEVENIFAVPQPDAVGTIDIDNAISFLEFDNDKVKIRIIKKDFADEVSGEFDFSFLPVYSQEEIAYGQTRWMIFQNIKTKENKTEFIINNLDDLLGKIEVLDPADRLFVIETLKPHGFEGREKELLITRFDDSGYIVKNRVDAGINTGYNEPWSTSNGKLFVYNHEKKVFKVFGKDGLPDSHPVQWAFQNNSEKFRRIKEMVFHPTLPFVLLVEIGEFPDLSELRALRDSGKITMDKYYQLERPLSEEATRHSIRLIRWDTDDSAKQVLPLISKMGNLIPSIDNVKQCSDFQFSPDGKWLVFRDETESRTNPVFIGIPVNEDSPTFFGEPLFLGSVLRKEKMIEAKGSAWSTDPTSFVVTDGLVLYKWELGNVDSARVINH